MVSLVPFEPYLIVPELMTHKQVNSEIIIFILSSYPYNFLLYCNFVNQLHWLNHYHAMVRIKVGEELKRQNRMVRRIIHFLKNLSSALLCFDVFYLFIPHIKMGHQLMALVINAHIFFPPFMICSERFTG